MSGTMLEVVTEQGSEWGKKKTKTLVLFQLTFSWEIQIISK